MRAVTRGSREPGGRDPPPRYLNCAPVSPSDLDAVGWPRGGGAVCRRPRGRTHVKGPDHVKTYLHLKRGTGIERES